MEEQINPQGEFEAIKTVHEVLKPLSPDARSRVFQYISDLMGIRSTPQPDPYHAKNEQLAPDESQNKSAAFTNFAELFDFAQPGSNSEKALAAGVWLQDYEGHESFDSQSANKLLKDLGHGLANITSALTALKEQKPALILQLKKSGSSQQARKTYKVTAAGQKAIAAMIENGSD